MFVSYLYCFAWNWIIFKILSTQCWGNIRMIRSRIFTYRLSSSFKRFDKVELSSLEVTSESWGRFLKSSLLFEVKFNVNSSKFTKLFNLKFSNVWDTLLLNGKKSKIIILFLLFHEKKSLTLPITFLHS